jgi:hypothetical protein
VGQLGRRDVTDEFMAEYWRQVVLAVHARRVVPIHWDNFSRALTPGVRPIPRPFDNHERTMAFLTRASADAGIELALPEPWRPVDPFGPPS